MPQAAGKIGPSNPRKPRNLKFVTLKEHWPEYLMEAAGLGIIMISPASWTPCWSARFRRSVRRSGPVGSRMFRHTGGACSRRAGEGFLMRAILQTGFGRPDVLVIRQIPEPEPKDGHAVIAVKAFETLQSA